MVCEHCQIKISGKHIIRKDSGKRNFFCCNGCAEVFYIIKNKGLEEFYKRRITEKELLEPVFYELDNSLIEGFIKPDKDQSIKLNIQGISCSSCTWLLSRILEKTEGIKRFSLSSISGSIQIEWDNQKIDLPEIIRIFYRLGYPALPYDISTHNKELQKQLRDTVIRFGTAGFLSMNLMVISLAMYIGYFQKLGDWNDSMFSWIGAILATPVLFGCGGEIFKKAFENLKNRFFSMDVLIALGAGAAYVSSVFGTLTGGKVYYDTAAMIVTLVLLGRLIEINARKECSETIGRYISHQAKKAVRVNGDKKENIHPRQIQKGDLLEVYSGETIPADGTIISGESDVNQAIISGEAMPVFKKTGDRVLGGSILENGNIIFRATEVGEQSFLGKLVKITEQAQNSRTKAQLLADSITARFVPFVCFVAILTFLFKFFSGTGATPALFSAIAVILIACPCALGLATPLAVSMAIGRSARRGIIIKESRVLEEMKSIKAVFIDKTGTLTAGEPRIIEHEAENGTLPYFINLEKHSNHPIARAIASVDSAENMEVRDFNTFPGMGIIAKVGGKRVACGTPEFLSKNGFEDPNGINKKFAHKDQTVVFGGFEDRVVASFVALDRPRTNSKEMVKWFKEHGMEVTMLTGDGQKAAEAIAKEVGITRVKARCLPQSKLDYIREKKKNGTKIIMVGDGANDAPALALADIGIAMGSGAGMALEHAHVTLLESKISDIAWLYALSDKTFRIIKQNFCWAFAYNIIGIPLAVIGVLTPIHSALMMVISSLCVVCNSLRISRKDPRKKEKGKVVNLSEESVFLRT